MRIKELTEAEEQELVIKWCELNQGKHPELAKLMHIPNGGSRHPAEAAHLKRLGVRAGVPDLFLPYPVGDHHGLWIELKSMSGKPTAAQREWILWLREQGYCAYVCRGAEMAIRCIEMYLGLRKRSDQWEQR